MKGKLTISDRGVNPTRRYIRLFNQIACNTLDNMPANSTRILSRHAHL